jgi:isopenicillin N synthase-like dioxygenase
MLSAAAPSPTAIPIIDLSLPPSEIIPLLRKTCIEVGFFYIINHGVPSSTLEKVLGHTEDLFALPDQVKASCVDRKLARGYTAFEEETLDPPNQAKGDTKEGFYIRREVPRESSEYNDEELTG